MSEYNAKNYTEQGGDVTHIGGKLVFDEGASVENHPEVFTPAENQLVSSATTLDGLKMDLNQLITKLKAAGIMEANTFGVSFRFTSNVREETVVTNNEYAGGIIVTGNTAAVEFDIDDLESCTIDEASHKWLCIEVGTGLDSLDGVTLNGDAISEDTKAYAQTYGLGTGAFPYYVAADLLESGETYTITVGADGYDSQTYTICKYEEQKPVEADDSDTGSESE